MNRGIHQLETKLLIQAGMVASQKLKGKYEQGYLPARN